MPKKTKPERQFPEYEISIPERSDILAYLHSCKKLRSLKHIAQSLNVIAPDERAALSKRLNAMLRDGQLIQNRRDGYGLIDKMDLVIGRVIGHADGYGFLRPDENSPDLFLSTKEMRSLLHGDRAIVRLREPDRRGKVSGVLVEVIERANSKIVGRYFKETNVGYVIPDNKRIHQDIFISQENIGNVKNGQFVVVEIIRQPDKHSQPIGKIIELLSDEVAGKLATEIAIRAYELPHEWPKDVIEETQALNKTISRDKQKRKDLRQFPFVTIDGEDARDFDDAVFCEKIESGWRLLIAIADVSHYVQPGSALDKEAVLRGTSVYFPQRVLPMLPEVLSNDLCSLKPGVDRYSMVCELQINNEGEVGQYRFLHSIIKSVARLTYNEVASIVVDNSASDDICRNKLLPHLFDLYALYKLIHAQRKKHGLLDFNATESYITVDESGNIKELKPLVRNDAHRMVEEFMLAANVAAADYLLKHEVPVLFRNHEFPKQEKLLQLRGFLAEFDLSLADGDEPKAWHYAELIESVKKRKDAHLIETVLLRSLSMAYYGDNNLGHFGLAFNAYVHFTSPIRRYPDLLVHRALRHIISKSRKKKFPYEKESMHDLGVSCSMAERRAEEAVHDVVQRLKCEFMRNKVGEEFNGTVSSVAGFGLFVELDDIYIEGLVHVTSLPNDYYHHDTIAHRLLGERTGKKFQLANRIKVKVARVDIEEKKIDFDLVS